MDNHLGHIHLFGNPEENFYVLGKKDKSSYSEVYNQISMLCARNSSLAKIIKTSTEVGRRVIGKAPSNYRNELKAYAEGIERPLDDLLFTMLLPEVVASFNKWTPNLLGIIPGCSSLFLKDHKHNGVIHTRILDYALSGPFEEYERSVLYDFNNRHKVFSFSTAGLALPSLSGMNEKGLTLATHYKHGNTFNLDGESIFVMAADILFNCDNTSEVVRYLKGKKSISYWGMNLSDANGNVLTIDINGDEIYQQRFDMNDHPHLFFSNRPLIRKTEHQKLQPFGNQDQCIMRKEVARIKVSSINTQNLTTLDALKCLTSDFKFKAKSAKDWKLSPITPSSIQAFSFNYQASEVITNQDLAPKFFNNNYIIYKNPFEEVQIEKKQSKTKMNSYQMAYKKIAIAQSSFDTGDISRAYHNIQMAIELFKGYPEYYIYKFYFYVFEYIYEGDKRELTYLYDDFKALNDKLPPYLQDQNYLFLMRLQKLIGHKFKSNLKDIKNDKIKELYSQEMKLNNIALKGLKKLIFPRMELLDIIYSY